MIKEYAKVRSNSKKENDNLGGWWDGQGRFQIDVTPEQGAMWNGNVRGEQEGTESWRDTEVSGRGKPIKKSAEEGGSGVCWGVGGQTGRKGGWRSRQGQNRQAPVCCSMNLDFFLLSSNES